MTVTSHSSAGRLNSSSAGFVWVHWKVSWSGRSKMASLMSLVDGAGCCRGHPSSPPCGLSSFSWWTIGCLMWGSRESIPRGKGESHRVSGCLGSRTHTTSLPPCSAGPSDSPESVQVLGIKKHILPLYSRC